MKLFNKIKQAPRKLILAVFSLIILAGVPSAINLVKAEFYPNRTPFDYNVPCNSSDANIYDRCGSLTGPVFNSFINTPSYGDERAFVDARRSDQTAAGSHKNVLPGVTEGSKEIVIRMYVHNNANQTTNASGLGIAKNTKVRVFLPTAEGQSLRARGYISADNATPGLVEDTVDFVDSKNFKVQYVPGSATLYNNMAFKNGTTLSDSIVTTGALIGDDALDGNIPGCFEYESIVQIKVKVITPEEPKIDFKKEVRKKGETEWHNEVSAKPGDKVEWLLTTQVKSPGVQNNINVRDEAAPHNELESGSVKWIDSQQGTVAQKDAPLFDKGINFGNYAQNGGFYVIFTTTVEGDFEGCEARARNWAFVRSDQLPTEIKDSADVIITKENCEPETPVYSCDDLEVTNLGSLKYRFTVKYTAQNGATFKSSTFDFGDGSQPLLTDQTTVDYTYAKKGTFAPRAVVTFTVDGKDVAVDGDQCASAVTITDYCTVPGKEHLPADSPECKSVFCTIPGKEHLPVNSPECVLPSTGIGDLFGLFTATTIAGGVAHHVFASRRFTIGL